MLRDLLSFLDNDSLKQPKILLIEDCQFDTAILSRIINKYYSFALIDHAQTKAEGVIFLKKNKYDVILLDLNLPDTESLQDVEIIRTLSQKTPVIIVTGTPTEPITKTVKEYGASGIIDKQNMMNTDFSGMMLNAVGNITSV